MSNNYNTFDELPGVADDSDLRSIHNDLKAGKILTSLDAVYSNRTVNLTKYISILRKKYGVVICDRWIQVSKRKRVKQYWINKGE